uniref:Uncharacterized protein n=1 Tax=Plectus sambesii TaxID=2011161 RepID=A0A914USC6_9BILA
MYILSASLTTVAFSEGTEFRDLLQGDIDIIEYLGSSDTPIDSPLGPSDGVSRGHTVQHLRVAAMMLNGNGVGGLQQQPTTSASGVSQQQQQNPQQLDAQRRRVTAPGNYVHPPRLPESPPETDSGAGSAGSPSSSSEQSPYSPDFQGYGRLWILG